MKRTIARVALFAAAAMALAACSSNNSGSASSTPPPAATLADQFGTGFGTDFAAAANSQPATPQSSDIIALSLTAQPTALH